MPSNLSRNLPIFVRNIVRFIKCSAIMYKFRQKKSHEWRLLVFWLFFVELINLGVFRDQIIHIMLRIEGFAGDFSE